MSNMDKDFWTEIRQALLMLVDVIERWFVIRPKTSELRKEWKKRTRKE